MTGDRVDDTIRRAIGGDAEAAGWIVANAETAGDAAVAVMAALLSSDRDALGPAMAVATTTRDRQLVEIARAHLDGRLDRVDALARDHLVDHPDNVLAAWIASGAALPESRPGPG